MNKANNTDEHPQLPKQMQWAGTLGIVEGAVGIAFAGFLALREALVHHDSGAVFSDEQRGLFLAYGTSVFFLVIFGVVAIAGRNLKRGKRWGRGPVVMLQLLLIPIAYYIFSAGQWFAAILVALTAIGGLALLFHPDSLRWAAARY